MKSLIPFFLLVSPLAAEGRALGPLNVSPSTWGTETRVMEATYQVAHAVDCLQTHAIARSGGVYWEEESAWVLGRNPSKRSVVVWCVAMAWGHGVVTQALVDYRAPGWLQKSWHATSIGLTVDTVNSNYQLGLKWGF